MATSPNVKRQSIDCLNDDILMKIFDYLHFDDKIRLRRTCQRWKILLDYQLAKIRALRLGEFYQGGFCVTSGLSLECQQHSARNYSRQFTATIMDSKALELPADYETGKYSVNQYDYLYRCLKFSSHSIAVLSIGHVNITYRLLMVLAHNLPNLQHLELIQCASEANLLNSPRLTTPDDLLPSLESFNNQDKLDMLSVYTVFNQSLNESVNMQRRLIRSALIKNCDLVRESKLRNYWPQMRHLLVRQCNLLDEFTLCLIVAITGQTLAQLAIESSQNLTGEFLNYCGPQLETLNVKYCPLLQVKFLDDFVKLKQFFHSNQQQAHQLGHLQEDRTSKQTSLIDDKHLGFTSVIV